VVIARTEIGGYCAHCRALRLREMSDAAGQDPLTEGKPEARKRSGRRS
jgi:hypothetical protein